MIYLLIFQETVDETYAFKDHFGR